MPDGVVRVAESGVRSPGDVSRLFDAGFHAVLVGETLVRAEDPAEALRQLRTGRVAS
jgi:indole-3-glycerol phosphate synthase